MKTVCAILLITFILSFCQASAQHHFTTPFDSIPNACPAPTRTAVASGPWSNPATWGGTLPDITTDTLVPAGMTVTHDSLSAGARSLCLQGVLTVRPDVHTRLAVITLQIQPGGDLTIGTAAAPIQPNVLAEIVILDRPLDLANDPDQFGHGVVGVPGSHTTIHGAVKTPTWIAVAAEPLAGANTVTLAAPVSGWRVGDRIVLTESRHRRTEADALTNHEDERTIAAITGTTLTLNAPLSFDHPAARDGDGVITFYPHVANLTRNVVIRSENPTGVRGHTLFTGDATVDLRYLQLRDLGRTRIDPLDPVTNHIGRYAWHMHHLTTRATLVGVAVDGGSLDHRQRWGGAVHDSDNGTYSWLAIYNMAGAGLMIEDGNENDNTFERLFISRTYMGNGASRADGGQGNEGSCIWARDGTDNRFRDSVLSNCGLYGATFFGGGPFLEFARMQVYGGVNGLTAWNINGADTNNPNRNAPQSVIKDFAAWHNHRSGVGLGYPGFNLTFDGLKVRCDPTTTIPSSGWWYGDYETFGFRIVNADIQGCRTGIETPIKMHAPGGGTFSIEGGFLRNHWNIVASTLAGPGGGGGALLQPETVNIIGVRHGVASLVFPPKDNNGAIMPAASIALRYFPNNGANVIQKHDFFVTSHNNVPGDDFRVYFQEQRPDFVLPVTGSFDNFIGAPVAGLTNTQALAQHGIAIAGAIAPCTTTRSGITGFVCGAPVPPPLQEICGNGIDDDKDGQIDEGCPVVPPPIDPCVSDPLVLRVTGWPSSNVGSRSVTFSTGTKRWVLERLEWKADGRHVLTVTDTRGCSAQVIKK